MQIKFQCIGKAEAGNGETQVSLKPVMGQGTILMSPQAPFTEIQLRTHDQAVADQFKARGEYTLTISVEPVPEPVET
ncbi:hypothetical protein BN948_01760 [Hydrogenophaga intermedia]|uniref:Uncharacterized protein n=1 Tax=Hydrogenophaga intermedia TaxID=65786 RepID=A0A1L1PHW0_HYDIT|nr:hypothetical protein [Hydrogenophaga intermedia]CDN87339.1 hypothetical protein BN948_01760 [Hydrogenophaga intermedia]